MRLVVRLVPLGSLTPDDRALESIWEYHQHKHLTAEETNEDRMVLGEMALTVQVQPDVLRTLAKYAEQPNLVETSRPFLRRVSGRLGRVFRLGRERSRSFYYTVDNPPEVGGHGAVALDCTALLGIGLLTCSESRERQRECGHQYSKA